MGYNAWNAFQCSVDEALVLKTAQQMVDLGLHDAGYTQFNLDDCWASKNRSSTGVLVPDPTKWPSGLSNLTASLKHLGFTSGIYSDSGWFTCAGFPGSFGNEELDVKTFMNWGFTYLKLDNCAIPFDDIIQEGTMGKYARMANAISTVSTQLKKTPMIFNLCEWGWSQVWLWGKQFGQSWRTTGDIAAQWDSLATIINFNSFLTASTDFFGRNDMDMLQLGNPGLSLDEAKSHWTAWALMKSNLLVGTNLSAITPEHVEILTNKEIIAINQDPVVGTSISPFRWGINPDWTSNSSFPAQFWSGPTQDGVVFMLLNTLNESSSMMFNLTESPWIRAGRQYSVRDLWTHTDNGTAVRTFSADLPAHGVVAVLMKDAGEEPTGLFPDCMVWWQCTAEDGTRTGG
jgi:alpha-galactosidase